MSNNPEQQRAPERSEAVILPELQYDPNLTNHDQVWGIIDAKYGAESYQQIIRSYVQRVMPAADSTQREALERGSVTRYMEFYGRIRREFMQTASGLREKFEWASMHVKEKTRTELGILRSALQGGRELQQFAESMPPAENRGEIQRHFDDYLEALNGRYFNANVNEGTVIPGSGIPILDPFIHADAKVLDRRAHPQERESIPLLGPVVGSDVFKGKDYDQAADKFQKKMEDWVESKLDWLLDNHATQDDLRAFALQISERYKLYSSIDADVSIISSADMEVLERASELPFDALKRMMREGDERIIRRLEVVQLMNPESWGDTTQMVGEAVIRDAIANGRENDFVTQMKTLSGDQSIEDFSDARAAFEDRLEAVSKVGVKETLDFVRKFHYEISGEVVRIEDEVEPALFRPLVRLQMEHLLRGRLVPGKEIDRMLVRFMAADREGRNDILAQDGSREILFRAIATATTQYPELFERNFRNLPDQPDRNGQSPYRTSPRIRKPSYHDRAAQMQALVILGKQAEVVVRQLSTAPEHRARNYGDEMSQAAATLPEDSSGTLMADRFRPPTPRSRPYVSALERGGFNTRDLALKGAKLFGAITVIANIAQSWGQASNSADIVERLFNTVELTATNHAAIAGAAVTVGAHMAERNKDFLRYPWLSAYERAGAMTAFKLDNLGARVGEDERNRFLQNGAEWRAMNHQDMSAEQIRELLQKANKRAKGGAKPGLSVADLAEVIHEPSILSTLTQGGKSERMRYLFYSKFLAGRTKPDVPQLRNLCTGTSHISQSPVNPSA